jgi:transcriptional regulator with XRE-family HTH domain
MKKNKTQKLYKNELIVAALEKMTIRELAAKSGISNDRIVSAKRGENLTIKTLRAVATGIGVPVCELVGCDAIVAEQ